jgi:hypothetical protein
LTLIILILVGTGFAFKLTSVQKQFGQAEHFTDMKVAWPQSSFMVRC